VTMVVLFPFSVLSISVLIFIVGLLIVARSIFFEVLIDNFILIIALINLSIGRRYVAWGKA
jgi:hypothetical protein